MSILQKYHETYVDNRVLNQKLPFNPEGSRFELFNVLARAAGVAVGPNPGQIPLLNSY